MTTADPPAWRLAYIPDKAKNNRDFATEMCKDFVLDEPFSFLTAKPGAKSMSDCKTDAESAETILGKFQPPNLDLIPLPPPNSVILVDDNATSMETLRFACRLLRQRGYQTIVCFVVRFTPRAGSVEKPVQKIEFI